MEEFDSNFENFIKNEPTIAKKVKNPKPMRIIEIDMKNNRKTNLKEYIVDISKPISEINIKDDMLTMNLKQPNNGVIGENEKFPLENFMEFESLNTQKGRKLKLQTYKYPGVPFFYIKN